MGLDSTAGVTVETTSLAQHTQPQGFISKVANAVKSALLYMAYAFYWIRYIFNSNRSGLAASKMLLVAERWKCKGVISFLSSKLLLRNSNAGLNQGAVPEGERAACETANDPVVEPSLGVRERRVKRECRSLEDVIAILGFSVTGTDRVRVNTRDAVGRTLLMIAVGRGDIEVATWLLDHGADVDARDWHENTSLLIAATGLSYCDKPEQIEQHEKYKAMIRLLIGKGASIYAENDRGDNVLMCVSATHGDEDLLGLLLEKGALVAHRNKAQVTPLMFASTFGSKTKVLMLLDLDILDARDEEGNTALMYAIRGENLEAVRLLLFYSNPINLVSSLNWRPHSLR